MNSMRNKVQLIGNLGTDPEIVKYGKDQKLVKIRLATNDSYTNKSGERVDNTQWHDLVAFGNNAEIAEKYLKKGKEIAIEGKLVNNVFEDKEGKKKYQTDIHVNEFLMLGSKSE